MLAPEIASWHKQMLAPEVASWHKQMLAPEIASWHKQCLRRIDATKHFVYLVLTSLKPSFMIRNYLRIAFRNVWKNKTFSAINFFGLALGIACSLGIFMIVEHESGFDTFHSGSDHIYRVVTEVRYPEGSEYQSGCPVPLGPSFRLDFPQAKKVARISGGYNNQIDIDAVGTSSAARRFKIETGVFYAEPEFFSIFNFKWIAGNPDSILSVPGQAAISRKLADSYFGSWQNAIGKTIRKENNEVLSIAGILEDAPGNTDFPIQIVISYLSFLKTDNGKNLNRDWGSVSSRSQAYVMLANASEKTSIDRSLNGFRSKHLGPDNITDYYSLQPLRDIHFNERYGNYTSHTVSRKTLLSLSLVGLFLVALACINFINLSTAQAIKRSREVGIRKVLGGKRWQLGIQFMGETFLLVCSAAVFALVLLSLLSPMTESILSHPVPMNPFRSAAALLFTAITIIIVTLLSGFYPAVVLSGFNPVTALKNKITAHSTTGILLRRGLVTFQFVIAQSLIIATLIILTQMQFFRDAPLGFDKDAIVTVSIPRDSVNRNKWEPFRQELLHLPGVDKVSLSYSAPASQSFHSTSFKFNQSLKDESFEMEMKAADAEYLRTYNLKLAGGRFYDPSDTAREVVVNETFLRKEGLHRFEDVVGKYLLFDKTRLYVAGVVKDFHQGSMRDAIRPICILPQKQGYRVAGIKLHRGQVTTTLDAISKLYTKTFPENLYEYNFLDESIARFYAQEKQLSALFRLFAVVGIFISCIGLYGLILFMTLQRVKEIGIRKIMGASVAHIIGLYLREFAGLVGIAFIIAGAVSWYFMNGWLNGFAYHIRLSWWMFAVVGMASMLLAILTVSGQTIKSALANPVKSLRAD